MAVDAVYSLGERWDATLADWASRTFGGAEVIVCAHPIWTFMILSLASMAAIARCCRTA